MIPDEPQQQDDARPQTAQEEIPVDDSADDSREAGESQLQARVRLLEAQLEESVTRARETSERLKEEHERLLRNAAEFENFKKRAQKEKEDIQKFGSERMLRDFLPVADNLERAIEHAAPSGLRPSPAEQAPSHAEGHALAQVLEGVKLVQKQLEAALGKHGVTGFSAVGKTFDPNLHEALMQQESDAPPNTVISEMARGYKLNDRLIRPAAVVVAKPKPAPASGSEDPASLN